MITDKDRERFTYGDCHYLARAIQKRTGWPIHALTVKSYPGEPCVHAFIWTPDGKCLDVNGLRSIRKVLDDWEFFDPDGHQEFPWKVFPECWRDHPRYGHGTYGRAAAVADQLLKQIGYDQI